MRKTILHFFIFLSLWALPATGQEMYEYNYWFDNDRSTLQNGASETSAWEMAVDVNSLTDAFHTLHIEVKQGDKGWSSPHSRLFLKKPESEAGTVNYNVWFDNDPQRSFVLPNGQHTTEIDVSHLTEGLHSLHFAATTSKGGVSTARCAYFLKTTTRSTESRRYDLWFDNKNETLVSGTLTGELLVIDVSGLSDGFHTIHCSVGTDGPATPVTKAFIKMPQVKGVDYLNCLCIVDDSLYKSERVSTSNGIVDWNLDVTGLDVGLHSMQVQVVSPSGAATNTKAGFFFRTATKHELQTMQCVYSIDGAAHQYVAGQVAAGVYHFDLDVASLPDGLHRISYMLLGSNGAATETNTTYFVKTPLGGNGIARYDYWVNEDADNATVVKLEKRVNPLRVIELLPMPSVPVRSKLFHFAVEDGRPRMYAKNVLHMQFFDASNRVLDQAKEYIDFEQSLDVFTQKDLTHGEQLTLDIPAENEVVWYTIPAEIGDSLALKTDLACSLQIFAPSGKEVYSANASEAMSFDGCHAYEDGTYYVAVHDVTAQKASRLTLECQHIEKYALLEYTPDKIGVPSVVTLSLLGNGFNADTRIFLRKDNERYEATQTTAENLSRLTAAFDCGEIALGRYDLIVRYSDNDSIIRPSAVHVEKADSVTDLSISIEGDPFFLVGSSATYKVKITNHSNVAAYCVPFTVSITCGTSEEDIPYLKFNDDLGAPTRNKLSAYLERAGMNKEDIRNTLDYLYKDDRSLFLIQKDSITGNVSYIGLFTAPCINGNSSITIPFTISKAIHDIQINATVKKHWEIGNFIGSPVAEETLPSQSPARAARAKTNESENECCASYVLNCLLTITETCVPFVADVIADDCVYGYVKEKAGGIFTDYLCQGESPDFSKLPKTPAPIITDFTASMIECIVNNYINEVKDEAIEKVLAERIGKKLAGKVLKIFSIGKDCIYSPTKNWISGCGDDDGDDHQSDPVNSWDPNDIYGYRSEANTPHMKKGVTEIPYTIEFENDPAFATASAHEVVILDTLDSKQFNLESFAATSVKIGNKEESIGGGHSFVKTIDMRPDINAVAQVELNYNPATGIARWQFTSLDPMTMEKTENAMDGFLPVNNANGDGQGEVAFRISLKEQPDDGDEIPNRAAITFDKNEPILTPVWVNVADTIAPVSRVKEMKMKDNETMAVSWSATDNRSGVWRYDLYVQYGNLAPWEKVVESVADTVAYLKAYQGIDYGFCVVATDSAGNTEAKSLTREVEAQACKAGDANSDATVDILDALLINKCFLDNKVVVNMAAADLVNDGVIDVQDVIAVRRIILAQKPENATIAKKRKRLMPKK